MDIVQGFKKSKQRLLKGFNCSIEYPINLLDDYSFEITKNEGLYFLSYWKDINKKTSAVIVLDDEKPVIYKSGNYLMIIAIDCIRLGFVFNKYKEVK